MGFPFKCTGWVEFRHSTSLIVLACLFTVVSACHSGDGGAKTVYYPSKGYSSLQSLIDDIPDQSTVIVEAGVYNETFEIRNKFIVLLGDRRTSVFDGGTETCVSVINGDGTIIEGFSFINCDDGILTDSRIEIRDNFFRNCADAIDFEDGSGGLVSNNVFYDQTDDAIDLDDAVIVEIVENEIVNSADDGIEIRLNPYSGETLIVSIVGNYFHANKGNGIQFIDYEVETSREFHIENNTFAENEFNDISYSDNENTVPSLAIGEISESVDITGNVFYPKTQSFSGDGENTRLRNNSFFSSAPDGALNVLPGFDYTDNTFVVI